MHYCCTKLTTNWVYIDSFCMARTTLAVFNTQYSHSLSHVIASPNWRNLVPNSNNNGTQAWLSKCIEHAAFNSLNMFRRMASLVSGWLNPLNPRLHVVSKACAIISICTNDTNITVFLTGIRSYYCRYLRA